MPYLNLKTNTAIKDEQSNNLMRRATTLLAERLGKSPAYIMVSVEGQQTMQMGGSDAPLAYLELKSIGLEEDATSSLSAALCGLIAELLEIPGDRVYIEFADAPRAMWGWDGRTFAR